jgi:hypothetical protein
MKMMSSTVRQASGSHFGPVVNGTERYIFNHMLQSILSRLEVRFRFRIRDPISMRVTGNIS